jgi:hypothetical protein
MTPNPYANPNGAIPLPRPAPPQPARRQVAQPLEQQQPPAQDPQRQAVPSAQPGAQPLAAANNTAAVPPAVPRLTHDQSIRELKKAVDGAHEILLSATTVFPFTLFPDIITLDREKLTISHRFFFRIAEVTSIRIEDILNIVADVGPFFGSLKISTRFFAESEPHTVNYLWRHDALRFKRVVQGYIISRQKGIDCSSFSPRQLTDMLDKLGQAAPGEDS